MGGVWKVVWVFKENLILVNIPKYNERLVIIDGFAGSGEYTGGEPEPDINGHYLKKRKFPVIT